MAALPSPGGKVCLAMLSIAGKSESDLGFFCLVRLFQSKVRFEFLSDSMWTLSL